MKRRSVLLVAAGPLVLLSAPAQAHLVTTGLGPVYDGVAHFALSLGDVLCVLAFALFAGLRGPRHGRWALFLLAAGWLAGGIFALPLPAPVVWGLTAAGLLLAGGLLAFDARPPVAATAALALGLGLLHGDVNGAGLSDEGVAPLGLLGIAATVFVFSASVMALTLPLRALWSRTAARVAGSWVTAVGLLQVGWLIHAGG